MVYSEDLNPGQAILGVKVEVDREKLGRMLGHPSD